MNNIYLLSIFFFIQLHIFTLIVIYYATPHNIKYSYILITFIWMTSMSFWKNITLSKYIISWIITTYIFLFNVYGNIDIKIPQSIICMILYESNIKSYNIIKTIKNYIMIGTSLIILYIYLFKNGSIINILIYLWIVPKISYWNLDIIIKILKQNIYIKDMSDNLEIKDINIIAELYMIFLYSIIFIFTHSSN